MKEVGKGEKGKMGSVELASQGNLMGRLWAGEAENPRPASELVKKLFLKSVFSLFFLDWVK